MTDYCNHYLVREDDVYYACYYELEHEGPHECFPVHFRWVDGQKGEMKIYDHPAAESIITVRYRDEVWDET